MSAPMRAGIFATAADFEKSQLTAAVECATTTRPIARDAFKRDRFMDMPATGATPQLRYEKANLFGFRACDGSEIRFVAGDNFRVERATPLYLYERERRVSVGKGGSRLVYDHFFSTSASDSVRPLTRLALKQAYPANHRFHDLLDLAFRSDNELMRYDDFHHEYSIVRVVRETFP